MIPPNEGVRKAISTNQHSIFAGSAQTDTHNPFGALFKWGRFCSRSLRGLRWAVSRACLLLVFLRLTPGPIAIHLTEIPGLLDHHLGPKAMILNAQGYILRQRFHFPLEDLVPDTPLKRMQILLVGVIQEPFVTAPETTRMQLWIIR
jgi:hypothetical protein